MSVIRSTNRLPEDQGLEGVVCHDSRSMYLEWMSSTSSLPCAVMLFVISLFKEPPSGTVFCALSAGSKPEMLRCYGEQRLKDAKMLRCYESSA